MRTFNCEKLQSLLPGHMKVTPISYYGKGRKLGIGASITVQKFTRDGKMEGRPIELVTIEPWFERTNYDQRRWRVTLPDHSRMVGSHKTRYVRNSWEVYRLLKEEIPKLSTMYLSRYANKKA